MQSITFVIGVKALLLVVAALYTAAIFTRPRRVGQSDDAPPKPDGEKLDWEDTAVIEDHDEQLAEPLGV